MNTLQTALYWQAQNIACLPCYQNSKYLLKGIRVKDYDTPPQLPTYVGWFFEKSNNIALVTGNGLAVLDFDTVVAYAVWKSKYNLDTRIIESRRGYHAYFWIAQPVNIDHSSLPGGMEVKTSGQVIMIPPSRIGDFEYTVFEDKPIMKVDTIQDVIECVLPPSKKETTRNFSFTRCSTSATDPISQIKATIPITFLFPDYKPFSSGLALAHCPTSAHKNGDKHPSLSLDLKSNRCQCFKPDCPLHGQRGNDILDAYQILNNLTLRQSIAELMSKIE